MSENAAGRQDWPNRTEPGLELPELDPTMGVPEQLRELAMCLDGLTDALVKKPGSMTIDAVVPVQRTIAHCLRIGALLSPPWTAADIYRRDRRWVIALALALLAGFVGGVLL